MTTEPSAEAHAIATKRDHPMAEQFIVGTGRSFSELGNRVSDAIHHALSRGMESDEAVSVVIKVACDYGRLQYGDAYVRSLADLILEFAPPQEGTS
jgi:hypothetical protein